VLYDFFFLLKAFCFFILVLGGIACWLIFSKKFGLSILKKNYLKRGMSSEFYVVHQIYLSPTQKILKIYDHGRLYTVLLGANHSLLLSSSGDFLKNPAILDQ
jgi:hypothetical protein